MTILFSSRGAQSMNNRSSCSCSYFLRSFQATAPYASAGAYVNFMTGDETDRVATAYGTNYNRLAQIKKQYDPDNVFHLNQNIRPAP